jgi:hypothetical protein
MDDALSKAAGRAGSRINGKARSKDRVADSRQARGADDRADNG